MRLGTAVVGAALIAVVAADGVAIGQVRGELRDRRAAAADRAWIGDVRQVAQDLLLARAPISDAGNLWRGDSADGVRYDVYVRGAATADLQALGDRLRAVPAPGPRADTHGRLVEALDAMTGAVLDLADEGDTDVEDELDAFAAATGDWDRLVRAEVADDLPSATTVGSTAPLTHAGLLFRWSSACAEVLEADDELLGQDTDRERAAVELELSADRYDDLLTELLSATPSPADREGVQRDLEPVLRGLREGVPALQGLASAVRAQDPDQFEQAIVLLDRLSPLSEAASRYFEAAGSTTCSGFFDPGVLPTDAPPDDVTRT